MGESRDGPSQGLVEKEERVVTRGVVGLGFFSFLIQRLHF